MSIDIRQPCALALLATCLAVPALAQTPATVPAPPAAASPGAGTTSPATATFADPSTAWHLYGGFGLGAADGKYGDVLQKPLQWQIRIAKQSPSGAWRFGVGGEQQLSKSLKWGVAGELLYGGTLDVNLVSQLPPVLGGRGNLVGSYDNTASVVVSVYGNWSF